MDIFKLFALIAVVLLVAGTVKGVMGLGLPTISVGMLGLVMPPMQAAAMVVIPTFLTNVWQTFSGRRCRRSCAASGRCSLVSSSAPIWVAS